MRRCDASPGPGTGPNRGRAQDGPTSAAGADLSLAELAFLTAHAGVPAASDDQLAALRVRSAAREADAAAGSLSIDQAAAVTGRTAADIRADIDGGKLLSTVSGDGEQSVRVPAWQFTPDGRNLPHLEAVLAALSDTAASVAQSVMTTPTTDLGDTDLSAEPITPAGWLAAGRNPEPVISYLATLGEQI